MIILNIIDESLQDTFKGIVHILNEIDGKKCIIFIALKTNSSHPEKMS